MKTYRGSCRCGKVKFEVDAEIDLVRVCDFSVCRRRVALIHRVPRENLRLLTPWENLVRFQWGSRTAVDYFCPTCGILSFRGPSDPKPVKLKEGLLPLDGWAVTVGELDDVAFEAFPVSQ